MSRKSKAVEAVVLLIDVGKYVDQRCHEGQTFLDKSKMCASRIVQRKIFSDSADEFNIITIGSTKTENELQYPHIRVHQKWLTLPNWNMLKHIEKLSVSDVGDSDWLDGLVVAVNLLKEESESKNYTKKKIVMMSNFGASLRSTEQVDDVIEALKDLEINLVVIGLDDEDCNESSEDSSRKSKIQEKGEAIVSRIVDETEGVMCGFKEAMSQLEHSQKIIGRAQPWHCDLQIGHDIFIPITGYKKFAPKKLLNWKKRSVDKALIDQETVYFQGDKQVEKSDVIPSHLFGQSVIPISDDDKMSMKLSTEKCLELLQFTKKANVPRHMLLGDSAQYIVPRSDIESAKIAISALVEAMIDLDLVAIVRKVYMKNTAPRVGALIPTCENESYFFYFVCLPFAEDERLGRLPSLSKVEPSSAQLQAVDQLIDAMDLSQFEEDEDPYKFLVNPTTEHTNNMIAYKALNPNAPLPTEVSESIKNLLQPKKEILEQASDALAAIKTAFNLEELEQKTYRRGATDLFNRNPNIAVKEEDVKPQNLADSMASLVTTSVNEIGTLDPEGNFVKLLEKGEPFNKLCEQMQIVVKKLFLTSTTTGLRKPVAALLFLRKQCITKNPQDYNQFIASLKDDLVERDYNNVWQEIAQERLGLITNDETEGSDVTTEQADAFYNIKSSQEESEVQYEMEAEDLLDMI